MLYIRPDNPHRDVIYTRDEYKICKDSHNIEIVLVHAWDSVNRQTYYTFFLCALQCLSCIGIFQCYEIGVNLLCKSQDQDLAQHRTKM